MINSKINIGGMTCAGCQNKITRVLKKMEGVQSVKVSLADASMDIVYNENILSLTVIEKRIIDLGYEVPKNGNKSNIESKIQLALILAILACIFIIIKHTIGFNFIPQVNQSMGYGMLFIVGLFTSLHCVAMCGGINVSQCMSAPNTSTKNKLQNLKPSFLYNSGRVVSYTIVGGVVGAVGSVLSFSGPMKGIVSILAGIFMLIMGLKMLDIFKFLRKFNLRMPGVSKVARILPSGPFFIGMLNGLMPCGPLQAIQIYALGTGSALVGALSMFFFSLGTFPLMFLIGLISSYLGTNFRKNIVKFGAVLVLVLGFIMFSRGLGLSGIDANFLNIGKSVQNVSVVKNDVQVVNSEVESGSYPVITVKQGVPVKWILNVKDGNLNGCNNKMLLPKYKIEKSLQLGENIIEFTPTENGSFVYTCWMGMISGKIIVEK